MRRRVRQVGAAVAAALAAGALVSAVRAAQHVAASRHAAAQRCGPEGQSNNLPLAAARRFHRFDLFYAGPRAAGSSLSGVLCGMMATADEPVLTKEPESYGLIPSWTFTYGSCIQPRGEGSCATPVDIQDDGSCWDNLGLFARADRPTLGHIRGVPAAVDQDSEGGHITLYTRRTTITIDAPTVGQAMQIALTLRDVNAADPSHYRLPPISARTLHGKSLCRRSR